MNIVAYTTELLYTAFQQSLIIAVRLYTTEKLNTSRRLRHTCDHHEYELTM